MRRPLPVQPPPNACWCRWPCADGREFFLGCVLPCKLTAPLLRVGAAADPAAFEREDYRVAPRAASPVRGFIPAADFRKGPTIYRPLRLCETLRPCPARRVPALQEAFIAEPGLLEQIGGPTTSRSTMSRATPRL